MISSTLFKGLGIVLISFFGTNLMFKIVDKSYVKTDTIYTKKNKIEIDSIKEKLNAVYCERSVIIERIRKVQSENLALISSK